MTVQTVLEEFIALCLTVTMVNWPAVPNQEPTQPALDSQDIVHQEQRALSEKDKDITGLEM